MRKTRVANLRSAKAGIYGIAAVTANIREHSARPRAHPRVTSPTLARPLAPGSHRFASLPGCLRRRLGQSVRQARIRFDRDRQAGGGQLLALVEDSRWSK